MGRRAMEMTVQRRRKRGKPKRSWLDNVIWYQREGTVG